MNQIEMDYTLEQKLKIKNWKESLEPRKFIPRIFTPCFDFNKRSETGQALYHLNIITDDSNDGSVYVGGEFGF